MNENINIHEWADLATGWLMDYVFTANTLAQVTFIIATLMISAAVQRMTATKLVNAVNKIEASAGIKRLMHSLRRQVFAFTGLVILFLGSLVAVSGLIDIETRLISAAMGLLVAWVVVRLITLFIRNSMFRNIIAVGIWIIAALMILGIEDETAAMLDGIGMNLGEFRLSALTVLKGLFLLFILLYAAGFASSYLEQKIRKSSSLTMTSKVLITKIVRIVLVTFALLVGITSAGIDLSLLAVFSGALGLGVGFGLQKGISNLFSGMLLLMDKSITPGDVIELPGTGGDTAFGWVAHMGARYTEIVTRDNKSFLIPNEDFITQQVVNWSHGSTLIRLEVEFGVHYNSDPHQIRDMAIEAAKVPERVVDDPEPVCWLYEFGDSSLNFKLRFWIKDAEKGVTNVRGMVMMALWDIFKENNVQIPYPHREVYIHDAKAA